MINFSFFVFSIFDLFHLLSLKYNQQTEDNQTQSNLKYRKTKKVSLIKQKESCQLKNKKEYLWINQIILLIIYFLNILECSLEDFQKYKNNMRIVCIKLFFFHFSINFQSVFSY